MGTPERDVDQVEVDRRMTAILARFPDRFSDEQMSQIRRRVARSIELGLKLRSVDLANSVHPYFDARAYADE